MVQTVPQFELGILDGKQITGDFEGGDIATDGGAILVAEAHRKLGFISKLAACLLDDRDPAVIGGHHTQLPRPSLSTAAPRVARRSSRPCAT